ncbi:MAG: adenylosuccinate lyase [Candidatus Altiarchaeales archaeon WOR_SM1_79]|nr:MAG: adenylosuccinate lyase [Candidatus Altiarchaeales archaeon WOR_SM1_79]
MPESNQKSPVCPLEYRYGREKMKSIFTEANKLKKFLEVEAALAEAHAMVGNIPKKDAEKIRKNANLNRVTVKEVNLIEAEIKHDVMAVVKALSEKCGDAGKSIHLGATSNDIIDTATALQLKEAINLIMEDLKALKKSLLKLAGKHKNTIMVGRTHGQFAVPTTFGLKMAVYASEVQRHIERLKGAKERILVGKMTGAVGTGAALGDSALRIQDIVMKKLGLDAEEASVQIIGRDRYIELISILANIATSLEKFATEIRNLQRSEIKEVSEAFDVKKQVGSSTMAHKKNPIISENICGLARIARAFILPAFENNVFWHERDLANSSGERFIIPHAFILVDDILVKMANVFTNLVVFPENMKNNLEASQGLIMTEAVMMALTKKGVGRQEAHEILRSSAMKTTQKKLNFKDALLENKTISKNLSEADLEKALDPKNYIGCAIEIVENMIKKYGD